MPLPIAHSLLGATIVALAHPSPTKRKFLPLIVGGFLANAADFDFALVFLLGSKEWHRGFTHSILFSVIVLLILGLASKFAKSRELFVFGLAFASHFILDFVTTKIGDGLELFWFFDSERYGLEWFGLSEKPSKMSLLELLTTVIVEIVIFLPFLWLILYLRRKKAKLTNSF